mmetsp:Transcript_20772/g.64166  ORF Transcript_20772/g.64166 Transcript_20772/m.64166 type:complete len:533 (+) Transcript_20772:92-1690(+)
MTEVTAAPTRNPETAVLSLLRGMPRLCCGENRGFDSRESYFYIDRSVFLGVLGLWVCCACVYLVWTLCRRCCWSCQRSSHFLSQKPLKASARQRSALAVWVCSLLLLYAGATIFSQQHLTRAADRATRAAEDLEDAFAAFEDAASAMIAEAGNVDAATASLSCPTTAEEVGFRRASNAVEESAEDAFEFVAGVDDKFRKASRRVRRVNDRIFYYCFLGVILFSLLLAPPALYGCSLSSRWALHLASKIAFSAGTVYASLSSVFFGVGANLSDFCRRPDAHFADVVQNRVGLSEDAEETVLYYSTCAGANPLTEPLLRAQSEVARLNASASESSCDPQSSLDALTASCSRLSALILDYVRLADCATVNDAYQRLVHSAACRTFLETLYAIAVQNAVAAAFILVFLVAANWVCETILLEEEYYLQPHPEIFAVTTFAGTSNQIDLQLGHDELEASSRPSSVEMTPVDGSDDDDDDDPPVYQLHLSDVDDPPANLPATAPPLPPADYERERHERHERERLSPSPTRRHHHPVVRL